MANTHQNLSKKERNRIDRMVEAEHLDSEEIDRAAKELNRKNKSQKKGTKFEHRRKITTQIEEVVKNKKGKEFTKKRDKITYGDLLPDTPVRTDIGYAGETPRTHGFRSGRDAERTLSDIRAKMGRDNKSFLMVAPNDEAWFIPMGEPDKAPASSDVEYLAEVHHDATHAPGREVKYMVGAELHACYTVTETGTVCTHRREKRRLVEVKPGSKYYHCMTAFDSALEVADKADYDKQVKAEAKRQRNA